jgi:hypothetical protein
MHKVDLAGKSCNDFFLQSFRRKRKADGTNEE